ILPLACAASACTSGTDSSIESRCANGPSTLTNGVRRPPASQIVSVVGIVRAFLSLSSHGLTERSSSPKPPRIATNAAGYWMPRLKRGMTTERLSTPAKLREHRSQRSFVQRRHNVSAGHALDPAKLLQQFDTDALTLGFLVGCLFHPGHDAVGDDHAW